MATEQSILGNLGIKTKAYQQQLQLLEDEYQQKKRQLESQRDSELAGAYLDYRLSEKKLPAELLAAGKQGGLADSEWIRLFADYQKAREGIGSGYESLISEKASGMEKTREEYRIKLQNLKEEAELQLAVLKAREAEIASKAAAKGRKGSGGSSRSSGGEAESGSLLSGKGAHGESKRGKTAWENRQRTYTSSTKASGSSADREDASGFSW